MVIKVSENSNDIGLNVVSEEYGMLKTVFARLQN